MADNPPQILQIDQPSTPPVSAAGSPPQTLQVDSPSPTSSVAPPPERGVLENIVGGLVEGAGKTVTGIGNMVATGAEKLTGQPAGSLHATFKDDRETPSTARDIGEGAENLGEWGMGEGALGAGLEGLSKASRIVQLAKKYPLIAETLAMAKDHPVIAKILGETAKGATVGGAQGAVKGSAEGKTKEGMEGGAVGGGVGGGAGEAIEQFVGPIAEGLAQKYGVGTSAAKDAVMGTRPGKRNYRFASDFLDAAPHMDDLEQQFVKMGDPSKTVEDWANRAGGAKEVLYKNKIQPLVTKNATAPLGGLNIANGIRKQIPDAMKTYDPIEAAKMEEIANQFLPGQKFTLTMQDAEQALQHWNAKLASTGYWSKLPQEREALLKTDGTIAGFKAAGDAIRDEFYGRLNQLEPGSNIAKLKKDYGALSNVENEIRGRVNVNDRSAPINLKETIGMITGLGAGGVGGPIVAALPFIDRAVNAPEKMIARGVQKAARPGEEGIVSKTVQAAGRGAKKATETLTAPAGAALGRIVFTASDGSTHSVPNTPENINQVHEIDPGAKFTQHSQ